MSQSYSQSHGGFEKLSPQCVSIQLDCCRVPEYFTCILWYMQVYRYRMYITHVKASCKRKPTIYNLAQKWHEWVRDQCAVVIRVWSSLFRTATKAKTRDFGHLVSITWLLCRRIDKIVRFVVASVEPIQRDFVNLSFAIHQWNQILMNWCLASLYTGLIANNSTISPACQGCKLCICLEFWKRNSSSPTVLPTATPSVPVPDARTRWLGGEVFLVYLYACFDVSTENSEPGWLIYVGIIPGSIIIEVTSLCVVLFMGLLSHVKMRNLPWLCRICFKIIGSDGV